MKSPIPAEQTEGAGGAGGVAVGVTGGSNASATGTMAGTMADGMDRPDTDVCQQIDGGADSMSSVLPLHPPPPQSIVDEWHTELFKHTTMIYDMYIAPSAPLEVNIPATMRASIERHLGIGIHGKRGLMLRMKKWSSRSSRNLVTTNTTTRGGDVNQSRRASVRHVMIPPFPDFWVLPDKESEELVRGVTHIYDQAFNEVCHLIRRDIFPRFRKSSEYAAMAD
jgi:hypothetical protein